MSEEKSFIPALTLEPNAAQTEAAVEEAPVEEKQAEQTPVEKLDISSLSPAEQAEEAFLFLLVEVQPFELDNKLAEHIAALTEILGLDAAESGVRELGDILLRGTAVVHDLIGVLDVYLL